MSQTIDVPFPLFPHEVPLARAGTLGRLIREDGPAQHQDRYGLVYLLEGRRYALTKPWRGHMPEVVAEVDVPWEVSGENEPLTLQKLAEGGMTEAFFQTWYQGVLERHAFFNGPYEFMAPRVYVAKLELLE